MSDMPYMPDMPKHLPHQLILDGLQPMFYNFIAYFNLDCVTFEALSKRNLSVLYGTFDVTFSACLKSKQNCKIPTQCIRGFRLFP